MDRLAGLGASIMPEILNGLERRDATNALTLCRGGAVGRFRGRLRRLEREMETELVTIEHEDGTVSKWPLGDDLFKEVFLHEHERSNRHHDGEDPGLAHPFVVALRTATNLEALMAEQGTMLGFWIGEDEIVRGLRERPGPPIEWNDEGTVCS